jgi:crotonobetainyl-CoA:carnitine CoA-transferase CaiB-like acyl-CoA transferase
MQAWCGQRTSTEALAALADANIPAGPVLSPQQALEHPQIQAMNLFVDVPAGSGQSAVPLMRAPVDLTATPAAIRSRSPRVGEHVDDLLAELGFVASETAALRQAGVI